MDAKSSPNYIYLNADTFHPVPYALDILSLFGHAVSRMPLKSVASGIVLMAEGSHAEFAFRVVGLSLG